LIVIKLQGGMGNQMFQYAFGLAVAKKLKSPLYFDRSFYNQAFGGLTPRSYELALFEGSANIAGDSLTNSFFKPDIFQKVLNKLGVNTKTIYKEHSLKFNNGVFEIKPPAYFDGFWQSEQYFNYNEGLIRKSLAFKKPLSSESQSVTDSITQQENPVSVHIRRGDYISSKTTNELHGICSIKYYEQAIELIREKTNDPYFYFFSDDPDWVNEHLVPIVENVALVHHNKADDSWQDMALMSKCKHHIIANSSFSWWGAWLNPSKEKIVIAPATWFSTETDYWDTQDLIPKSWIRIPNE
jgi:hypothetical protein